jgi:hypothetical protein
MSSYQACVSGGEEMSNSIGCSLNVLAGYSIAMGVLQKVHFFLSFRRLSWHIVGRFIWVVARISIITVPRTSIYVCRIEKIIRWSRITMSFLT